MQAGTGLVHRRKRQCQADHQLLAGNRAPLHRDIEHLRAHRGGVANGAAETVLQRLAHLGSVTVVLQSGQIGGRHFRVADHFAARGHDGHPGANPLADLCGNHRGIGAQVADFAAGHQGDQTGLAAQVVADPVDQLPLQGRAQIAVERAHHQQQQEQIGTHQFPADGQFHPSSSL